MRAEIGGAAREDGGLLSVAVVGSPRRRGNSSLLVDVLLAELAARGLTTEKLHLADYRVEPCRGHDDCARRARCPLGDDDVEFLLSRVYAADVLVLATPVYYENVSAQLKAFIDRNVFYYSRERWLRARAVGLLAVSAETGLDDALAALERYVRLSSDREIPLFRLGGLAEKAGEALADEGLVARVRELAAALAAAAGV